MFYTNSVYKQTVVETNYLGSISKAWTVGAVVMCDIQPVTKELVRRDWGFTDEGEYYQGFSASGSFDNDDIGTQVLWNSEQYLMLLVEDYDKIGTCNHCFTVMRKVV